MILSNFIYRLIRIKIVRHLLLFVLCCTLLTLFVQLPISSSAQSETSYGSLTPLEAVPNTAEKVETGILAMNLYNLDTSSNTYSLDFYAWFKWKGKIDPTANLEYTNGVEDWGFTSVPAYEQPEKLPDGSFYQILRVEGRFVQPFALARYPLDQQRLRIFLENSVYTADQLVYVEDKTSSGFSEELSVPGWQIQGFSLESLVRKYSTNFGDTRLETANQYSTLLYSLVINRPVSFFIWKLLFPLIIVVVASWGALLLNPQQVDSRIILPVTALLTTVFLQQSYSSALPDVGYLVLLDKIYAIAYFLIVISILEAIITADWISSSDSNSLKKVFQLDRAVLIIQAIVLVCGIGLLILLA